MPFPESQDELARSGVLRDSVFVPSDISCSRRSIPHYAWQRSWTINSELFKSKNTSPTVSHLMQPVRVIQVASCLFQLTNIKQQQQQHTFGLLQLSLGKTAPKSLIASWTKLSICGKLGGVTSLYKSHEFVKRRMISYFVCTGPLFVTTVILARPWESIWRYCGSVAEEIL